MSFPATRLRRLRRTEALRRLVRETRLSPDQLVLPLFVRPGTQVRRPIESMPGCFQLSTDELVKECQGVAEAGVPAVLLFGIPPAKDSVGTEAYAERGIVQRSVRAIKKELPDLLIITDVCLCEYTDHGHCGVVHNGEVDNDATLELLGRMALSHAQAGVDMVAPSDMMDGRVGAIRKALDAEGFVQTPIMSYAAKYASSFYGPFRDAAESPPQFGDRRGYQMDPPNSDEALREVALDLEEGADIVMVKPALPYLDIIRRVKDKFGVPTAAYCVSGEYAMIKAAAEKGWLDERRATLEVLTSIRRAGADVLITYHAREAAQWLSEG